MQGTGIPNQERKHPVSDPQLFRSFFAAYNDFIKYVCNPCHYSEVAHHLKRRNQEDKGQMY